MKLLIADDETQIRLGLAALPWESVGIQEVLTAVDGLEALRLCREHRPEIVLTDIAMPGLTGLELGRQLLDMYAPVRIIIFSGYSDFHLAREALQIRAIEYFLKPIDVPALLAKVEQAGQDAQQERQSLQQALRYGHLDRAKQLWQTLNGHAEPSEEALWEDMRAVSGLSLPAPRKQPFLAALAADTETADTAERMLLYLYFYILPRLERLKGAPLPPEAGWMPLVFEDALRPDQLRELRTALQEGNDACRNQFQATVSFAAGGSFSNGNDLAARWKACRGALQRRLYLGEAIFLVAEEETPPAPEPVFPAEALGEAVASLNMQGAEACIHAYWTALAGSQFRNEDKAYEACVEMKALLYRTLAETGVTLSSREETAIPRWITLERYERWTRQLYARALKEVRASAPNSRMAAQASAYIREHYTQNLCLEEVAQRVGLSKNYFASRFRKETGVSFVEYLNRVRIQEAKRLLLESRMPMEQIAEATGFSDARYFATVFKRRCGISPAAYRK